MGFKCGIVGLPNVGKSTLFNALTEANIEARNYPFCTIDPNIGIISVPDNRLDKLAKIVNPQEIIPTAIEFVDIAGLVKGASKGEGLGNKFLANIRETDAIAHVVRCFESTDIIHVHNKIDPVADIETINTELLLADLETVERALNKVNKNVKSGNKIILAEKSYLEAIKEHLNSGKPIRTFKQDKAGDSILQNLHLITNKPVMYIANVSEDGFKNNPLLSVVSKVALDEDAEVVPICASTEAEIAQLDYDNKLLFLHEMGIDETGLDRVIHVGYKLLNLQTYFTAGEKEVRAWTISKGSTAPIAAGKIHSDFEKGFIRAEVIGFNDFIQYNGESGAKEAGKWRLEGKDYIVQDGDVIHFRFNV